MVLIRIEEKAQPTHSYIRLRNKHATCRNIVFTYKSQAKPKKNIIVTSRKNHDSYSRWGDTNRVNRTAVNRRETSARRYRN
ncbi:hypothetical protein QE152_g9611 [Popillia japonica]|uniref:Uncharacterized protein n=1 Tax=Popillia japonica TaxID=7064 RepID=A0AAW1LY38_POPJA